MASVLNFGAVRVHLGEKSGKYPDGNQLIVQGGDTRVAFDTPEVANRIGPELDTVDLVILGHVHEDHMAGLHRLPHARVQVHEADLAAAQSWQGMCHHYGYPPDVLDAMLAIVQKDFHYQPRPDATAYSDGALWDLGGGVRVRAHHLPGHTAGHCALVVESEGLAFIGDIDLSGFGPYYGDATSSLRDFRQTLKKVAELDARIWATSHHKAVITDRTQFMADLARFASKIDERSAQLLGYLQTPHTLDELVNRRLLYPAGYDVPFVPCAERHTIAMHLDELLAQGQVAKQGDGRYVAL
ncbi:MBL fold metallo-hydrolase [Limnohabitans sp. G3-2]|uniref:MBL fold metallo-hydrolase n=1 Tax=Limnohabitans sp. G3-2 TaxID=1100711 RepID=UPI000C1EA02A|nr:MBL fold metallo-hydrolase [Limnohabitans sp. G3-2]PIT73221.1 MBL fold metallo-hydrolase [Limnohabitans sp. G3-2]